MAAPATRSTICRTDSLYAGPSAIHGVGVFAARPFAPGDLVECCPVVVCPDGQEALLEETALRGLYFTWEDDEVAVALGYGSLYNHSWTANASYDTDFELAVVRILAFRPIEAGDEITINYTGHPDGRGDLWFDASELRA